MFLFGSLHLMRSTVYRAFFGLVTDREVLSVSIVIGVVAVGFFFRRFDSDALQQNLAIASLSNFLSILMTSIRSAV